MPKERMQEQGPYAAMGLGLLWAELQALALALPGVKPCDPSDGDCAAREAQERAHEAEVEAAFDNMPV